MSQQTFDPGHKWLLEEYGSGFLYLAGARSVLSCKARKAEVVHPRKLPDGLLEAQFAGSAEPRLILVEVATYPEERVVQQMQDNIRIVRQARGVLADAMVVCLCPRGKYRVPEQAEATSALGWTGETLRWKVVELWKLPAEELLAAPNIGVVPWASLAHYEGPPEVLLQRCRDRIDKEGGKHTSSLLAVSQVFARLHFDKPEWLDILGGRKAMIESPLIQEIGSEFARKAKVEDILHLLQNKFTRVPPDIKAGLEVVQDKERFLRLLIQASDCASLQAFEDALRKELPPPAPISTRGKRRRKPST